VKGATSMTGGFRLAESFNPRAREGRDLRDHRNTSDLGVSIHAPVKGATRVSRLLRARIDVSIHAPVKGATLRWVIAELARMFQSTRP